MDIYDVITEEEMKKIVDNLEFITYEHKSIDDIADDGESQFLNNMYSSNQSFGYTDYKDHREDNFNDLKKLIIKNLLDKNSSQLGHFYSKNGEVVNKMKIKGYLGGITGEFIYKDNLNAFNK